MRLTSARKLEVAPTLIDAYFENTDAAGRTAPLATPHPAAVYCSIELTMPSAWSVKPERKSAADPAFYLVFSSRGEGRTVGYEYSFASLADHIDVAELAHHGAAVDEARRLLTRSLSWRPLEPGPNPWAWIAMAVTAIACLAAGPRAYRYLASPAATEHNALVPMSGWLTLLGLRLCLTPLVLVKSFHHGAGLFRRSGWARFVDPTYATYHPLVAVFGLVELMAELAIGFYVVFLIACFFQRRRSFALHLTIFTIVGAMLAIIDAAGNHLLGTGVGVPVRAAVIQIVVGVAFLLYVYRSDAARRVFLR